MGRVNVEGLFAQEDDILGVSRHQRWSSKQLHDLLAGAPS